MTDKPWFAPDHQPVGIPRARRAGEVVWRLVDNGGHIQSCELHDDTKVGAGWDVLVILDGEPWFPRRCPDAERARYYAEAMRQDNLRGGGWHEQRDVNP
jgi:hypothetical protein